MHKTLFGSIKSVNFRMSELGEKSDYFSKFVNSEILSEDKKKKEKWNGKNLRKEKTKIINNKQEN